VHVTARSDYAVRALAELASTSISTSGSTYHTVEELAEAQRLPVKFLEAILTQLRRSGLLESRRGATGGFRLARPASEISVADVMRAVDGPLAAVRGLRPEDTAYDGAAMSLPLVWIAMRAAVRDVLESVSLADVASGTLPERVTELTSDDSAWHRR
jgi:Rrf2 family protein